MRTQSDIWYLIPVNCEVIDTSSNVFDILHLPGEAKKGGTTQQVKYPLRVLHIIFFWGNGLQGPRWG